MRHIEIVGIFLILLSASSIATPFVSGKQNRQQGKWPTLTGDPTEINAHRGETVFLPENTIGSTEQAAYELAEHIELDIGLSKDGQLVVMHDLGMKARTNVDNLPEFANRMSNYTGVVDDSMSNVTMLNDWFVKDFTVNELRQLRIQQRNVGIRSQLFNNVFYIPSFDEFLDTVHHAAFQMNRSVGIVIELKNPVFYNVNQHLGDHYVEDMLLEVLKNFGYPLDSQDSPNCKSRLDNNASIVCGHLVIQSFDLSSMQYIHQKKPNVPISALLNGAMYPHFTLDGLRQIATWSNYFSPNKELLYTGILAYLEKNNVDYDKELVENMGGFVPTQDIVTMAHDLGMKVYIWTIYDSREASGRGCAIQCEPQNKQVEVYYYFDLGVDGMFSENMQETRELRMKYQYEVINGI